MLSGTKSTPQASGGLHIWDQRYSGHLNLHHKHHLKLHHGYLVVSILSHLPWADSPIKHLAILLSTTLGKKEIAGKHIIEKVKGTPPLNIFLD